VDRHGPRWKKEIPLSANISAASVVTAGQVKFGNHLPISIIAGPCQLESRSHALEVASALKEIAGRLKIGISLQDLVRQGQPHLRLGRARHRGSRQALPIFAEIVPHWAARTHRRARARQCAEVAQAVDVLQIRGVPVPPDRSAFGGGRDRQGSSTSRRGNFWRRGIMANVVGKITARRQSQRAGHRNAARRLATNTLVSICRALPILARTQARPSSSMHPLGAAAGREGRFIRRRA